MNKTINLSEYYFSNEGKELFFKVRVGGKSSITTLLQVLSGTEMVDYEQIKDIKEKWKKYMEKEELDRNFQKQVEDIIREKFPNIEFTNIGASYQSRNSGWGDPSSYALISYKIKNDGHAIPHDVFEEQIKNVLHKLRIFDISLYGYLEVDELEKNEVMIQPISFDGYVFEKIPFSIDVYDTGYGDGEYRAYLVNEELDMKIRKSSEFYSELMNHMDKILRERFTGAREIKEKLMKYVKK